MNTPSPAHNALQTDLRAQRTYHVSDARLHAFGQLNYAQRLQWVEQCSQFVRMAQAAKATALVQSRVSA
ncbi:MAG: hypothetical protein EAZ37_11450 [Burkholderiales bacterium]|nr:MAG: hypothetical protein EAZ37_11450 [Burkholderiales bacterium]